MTEAPGSALGREGSALVTTADDEQILREALVALEMPPDGVGRWLGHMERFYLRHGAGRHYGECMALVKELQRLLVVEPR